MGDTQDAAALTLWQKLARPFPEDEIKTYTAGRKGAMRYITARHVQNRLDEVLTPMGWSFKIYVVDEARFVVQGTLSIFPTDPGVSVRREDVGYPNSDDDDEPLKSAVSDALKRCAVHYGIGRHLYEEGSPGSRSRLSNAQIEREFPGAKILASPERLARLQQGQDAAVARGLSPALLGPEPSAQEVEDALLALGDMIRKDKAEQELSQAALV